MGITGLWDVLGDGHITSLSEYAAKHFEVHKRPLRIAVDEAGWRFNNLTDAQVATIRESEPLANLIEKTILWRILRLLKLNVQPLFVFDGPQRPWKRGRKGGGGKVHEKTRLLCEVLDHLKIPHHRARGEAEAECARLNTLGVVDAVWSDDGDAFMFGCKRLIKDYKPGGKRQDGIIQVYEADSILEKHDFDAESLVLFALLAGGDYNEQGLRGCGSGLARSVATRSNGVARTLRPASRQNMDIFRAMLKSTLQKYRSNLQIPLTYPDVKALGYYQNPTVSTDEELHHLRGLRDGWYRPIAQPRLRTLLREKFNFGTREYLKHLAPIFVVRFLLGAISAEERSRNLRFDIQIKRTRRKKGAANEVEQAPDPVAKVTFLPLDAVEIDLSDEPRREDGRPLEDWSKFAAKDGTPYDPAQRIECDILACFLRHGLPEGALENQAEVPKKRRKAPVDGTTSEHRTPPSKKRKTNARSANKSSEPGTAWDATSSGDNVIKTGVPVQRKESLKNPLAEPDAAGRKKKASGRGAGKERLGPPMSPPPVEFRRPVLTPIVNEIMSRRARPCVVDLDESEDEHETYRDKQMPFASTLGNPDTLMRSSYHPYGSKALYSPPSDQPTTLGRRTNAHATPGDVFDPALLRELRAAASLPTVSKARSAKHSPSTAFHVVDHEVIDLT